MSSFTTTSRRRALHCRRVRAAKREIHMLGRAEVARPLPRIWGEDFLRSQTFCLEPYTGFQVNI
jgi:hypothetical protein